MLERMLAGVSTRRYARTGEPVGTEIDEVSRSTSKSAVSREFVSRTRENLVELMSRPLGDLRLAGLMLDGIELKGRCCVVALAIDTDGVKHPLGLWDGSTENATVATTLLANLVERGLDVEQGVLVVLDGAKALRKAVRDVLGVHTPVPRCVRHKERNVLAHLPERDQPLVRRRLRTAWALEDHNRALEQLRGLAAGFPPRRPGAAADRPHTHPGAAASLREGMEETLTVTRLGIRGRLKRPLASTNPCESMIETVRRVARNVKHWSSGDMCLRWTAAGMLEAKTSSARSSATPTSPSSPSPSSATSPPTRRRCADREQSPDPPDRGAGRSSPRPPDLIHSTIAVAKFHDA